MKWRIVKKKFKKTKPRLIGTIMCAETKSGQYYYMKVKDVKIKPGGGKRTKYEVTADPYTPPEQAGYSNKGYNLSFNVDVSTKKAKKQIRKLIDSVIR